MNVEIIPSSDVRANDSGQSMSKKSGKQKKKDDPSQAFFSKSLKKSLSAKTVASSSDPVSGLVSPRMSRRKR